MTPMEVVAFRHNFNRSAAKHEERKEVDSLFCVNPFKIETALPPRPWGISVSGPIRCAQPRRASSIHGGIGWFDDLGLASV